MKAHTSITKDEKWVLADEILDRLPMLYDPLLNFIGESVIAPKGRLDMMLWNVQMPDRCSKASLL